jgi:ankyrin repeat protein
MDVLELLLSQTNPSLDVNLCPPGMTPILVEAAQVRPPKPASAAELIKALLAAGADARATDENGFSALMHCRDGPSVEMLLHAAPDMMTHQNHAGRTALSYLCAGKPTFVAFWALLEMAVEFRNKANAEEVGDGVVVPVPVAGDMATVDAIVGIGADIGVDIQDNNGDTALHFAMLASCDNTVSTLLRTGADAMIRGYEDTTVLMKPFFDDDHELRSVVPFEDDHDHNLAAKYMDMRISVCLKNVMNQILTMNL